MRTMLRGKVTLLFLTLGLLLAIPAVALADIVTVTNETNINGDTTKAPGATGQARVFLTNTNATTPDPNQDDVNACNAAGAGNQVSITLGARNPDTLAADSDITFTTAAANPPVAGQNPAVITTCDDPATTATIEGVQAVNYQVAANAPNKVVEIYVASISGGRLGSEFNKTDTLKVTINNPNTAPTTPGKPELASGFNTPNQGVFDLTWTASTDDGKPNPPAAVTYRLEHQDANDAAYSLVSGAGTLSTNSFSFPATPATSNEAEGTWTYQVKASDSLLSSAFSDASSEIKVDKSAPSQPNANFNKPAEDTVGGWYKDSVTVSYNGSTDPALLDTSAGSGVASYTANQQFNTTDTHNYSGTATDNAGNVSAATTGSVKVDAANPTVGITGCPTSPVLLNSSKSINVTAGDVGSGLVSDPSGSVSLDTSSLGQQTKTIQVADKVGHTNSATCTYSVNYNFIGFSSPVDNDNVLNTVKAGQAIPLKWQILDANGPVTNLSSVKVTAASLTCPLGASTDLVEEVAAGSSGLQNLGGGYYQFNWKTPTTYQKSCKTMQLDLGEGQLRTALFQFTR